MGHAVDSVWLCAKWSLCNLLFISHLFICLLICFCLQVNILDAAAVGEVLETFAVCSSSIDCICVVPEFDAQDPDVLASKKELQWNLSNQDTSLIRTPL